jgi:hypothetical protein
MWVLSLLAQQSKERKQCSGLLNNERLLTILHGNELLTRRYQVVLGDRLWVIVVFIQAAVKCEVGWVLVPKHGCLLTLAYYAFPRWYEFGEQWWNDILTGKPKNSEKNLSQCHSVHHKSHIDWPGCEPWPPQWEASDEWPEPWRGPSECDSETANAGL